MKDLQFPRRRRQNLSTEQVGQETLIYDEQWHMAFCLNPVSSAVWDLCDGHHSPLQIAQDASLRLAHPITVEVVEYALDQLRTDGILEVTAEAMAPASLSRRTLLVRAGTGAALMLPVVATIMAPKAAQAYGCVDCPATDPQTVAPVSGSGTSTEAPASPSNNRQLSPE